MRVVGIDAGYRNFAYCALDGSPDYDWRHALWTGHEDWGTFRSMDWLRQQTLAWCQRNKRQLDDAQAIVLERQLKKKFMIQNR